MTDSSEKFSINIAVRDLAELSRREGGLASPFYGGVTGVEGIALHKEYARRAPEFFPGAEIYLEYSLAGTYSHPDLPYELKIQGRCDSIAFEDGSLTLIEVKSFRGSARFLPKDGDTVHWAQAKIYAYLLSQSDFFLEQKSVSETITVALHYLSLDNGELVAHEKTYTRDELEEYFSSICKYYLTSQTALITHRKRRNILNCEASFPFPDLRLGQHDMMREVTAAIRDKQVLFVNAPTGSGKTIAVLYPALKAQAHGLNDSIYYLTPSRSQRTVAEEALSLLREHGFLIRAITIRAKRSMCAQPKLFCDKNKCPFATTYYARLHEALGEFSHKEDLLPDDIFALGQKYQLCPYELSIDLMKSCDLVVCDYNYIFDPRIRWQERLDDPKHKYTLLVDEAHNLAERSRSMFSAIIDSKQIEDLKAILPQATAEADDPSLVSVLASLTELEELLNSYRNVLAEDVSETNREDFVKRHQELGLFFTQNFFATHVIPPRLESCVARLNFKLMQFFEFFRDFPQREAANIIRFELLFFQRIAEEYYDQAYITAVRRMPEGKMALSLLSLDASEHLTNTYYGKSSVVFFSATLEPYSYFVSLLNARHKTDKPEVLKLNSPFDRKRRLVIAYDEYSVRYRDRALSLAGIAELILELVSARPGNFLLFCPSFAYLRQLQNYLKEAERSSLLDIIVQPQRMNDQQKTEYLRRFTTAPKERSLLGLTVLGSLFTEGVDLKGEALTGVIVIGTGLPALTPEREILRQYHEAKSGLGYQYAYTWPGFNRVTQAAGRLIRTPEDYGVVLLVDDRYSGPEYQQLYPKEWDVFYADDKESCLERAQTFWADIDSTSI
jgi:DNA excision repair protein ERCC-2